MLAHVYAYVILLVNYDLNYIKPVFSCECLLFHVTCDVIFCMGSLRPFIFSLNPSFPFVLDAANAFSHVDRHAKVGHLVHHHKRLIQAPMLGARGMLI